MYTCVTVVGKEGAENPQAAMEVVGVTSPLTTAKKLLAPVDRTFVPPVVGRVAGRALVSRGPASARRPMERVAAGDLVMVTRGLLVMDTEGVLVGNFVPKIEGSAVGVATGEPAEHVAPAVASMVIPILVEDTTMAPAAVHEMPSPPFRTSTSL